MFPCTFIRQSTKYFYLITNICNYLQAGNYPINLYHTNNSADPEPGLMVETDTCRRVLCSEKFQGVTAEGSRGEQEGSASEADRESAEAEASGGSERSQSSCADSLPTRASQRPSLSAIGLRSPPCYPTRGQVGAAYPVGEGYPPVLAPFQRRPFSSTQV